MAPIVMCGIVTEWAIEWESEGVWACCVCVCRGCWFCWMLNGWSCMRARVWRTLLKMTRISVQEAAWMWHTRHSFQPGLFIHVDVQHYPFNNFNSFSLPPFFLPFQFQFCWHHHHQQQQQQQHHHHIYTQCDGVAARSLALRRTVNVNNSIWANKQIEL